MTLRHHAGAPRPRLLRHRLPWLIALAVLIIELTALALTPPAHRAAASTAMTGASLLALLLIARRAARRAERRAQLRPPIASRTAPAAHNPDSPSTDIALAYELARRGLPPAWIAAHCNIPYALAQLIAADPTRHEHDDRRRPT